MNEPAHVLVRVWLPDRPGALGQVASRIGAVRGDLLAIDILERGGGQAIDELVVRLPGPWDGPVRIVDVTDRSFRLATLKGHMEAGEIEFRASTNDHGWTIFEIESWARSGDWMFRWLYDRLPVARELQLHMWSHFCERVVRIADGILMTNVEVHTCTPDRHAVTA